jgi:hypothetical protein
MSIRATARLYLTADSALVTENDPAGRTLYCNPGDEISDADLVTYKAYFESFGWIGAEAAKEAAMSIKSVQVKHDDASGAVVLELPPRAIIQDVFVICTEAAAGSPDVDFGEFGGDTDGLLDGLGTALVCDTLTAGIDTSADFKGRGALITSTVNEDNQRTKTRRYYPNGVTLTNVCNSAGTAGEWKIFIMYIVLPEIIT